MKKAVQKTKSPTYLRYEFSDETGRPEGGDIFHYTSAAKLLKMMNDVLAVAKSDGVTVGFTVGQDDHFFTYLKNTGLSSKEIEAEMVDTSVVPLSAKKKASKPKKAKKKASK